MEGLVGGSDEENEIYFRSISLRGTYHNISYVNGVREEGGRGRFIQYT